MASVSPLFAINNKHAFTGDNWQKHPVLLGKYNDQKLFEFAMPMNTTFTFGRSWSEEPMHKIIDIDNDQEINFVTLTGSADHKLSSYVASADNIDNKSVVFTIHKDSAATGWPVNYLGTEKREVIKDCDDKVRTMTMSRQDNRVFKHQPTRNDSYTFQVIWPKNLTRAMTLVNTEAPETQECADPPQTLENDETIDYAPSYGSGEGSAGGAGRAGAAGGADARVGLLDKQTIKAITDQMDPTKIYTAFKAYALNEKNEGHILELSLQVEENFTDKRMPFGTETQASFLWFEWAKKPENKSVLDAYSKIATDFNTAHKDQRPERKKRKANARTGGRTGADRYTGDESD